MKKCFTRKIAALFLSITLTVSLLPAIPAAAVTFAGGTGQSGAPYLISTAEQLAFLRDQVNSGATDPSNGNVLYDTLSYKLTQDIDLGDTVWTPIRDFSGTFDGGGFTLSNYSISTANGVDINNAPISVSGLFGVIDTNGTVENLGVSGTSNLAFAGDNPPHFTGGVAAVNEGKITCCRNSGALTDNSPTSIGGIAGESSGTVKNCYNTGAISSTGSPSHVGGILGDNDGVALQYCYNIGNLTGVNGYVGGVAAYVTASPSTTNCFSTSQVSGTSLSLSGVAYTESEDDLAGCDFYSPVALHLNSRDIHTSTGESSADFFKKGGSYYTGGGSSWDFTGTWKFGADDYPTLIVFDHASLLTTPTLQLSPASDSGKDNSDGITNKTTPTFTGTADASSIVTLYDTDGSTILGTTTAASDGKFSITTSALSEGIHTITAKAKSASDSSLVSSASTGVTIKVDTTAPGKPAITNVSGTVNTAAPVITGTAEAVSIIAVYDGGTQLGSSTADGSGNFSFTPTTALSEGSHTITATAADAAGNVSSASAPVTITVDTTAPGMPTITNASGTVNTSTPVITGTAEAGSAVTVYDGGTLLGSATADGSGNFSFTPRTALSEGSHSITATAADAAGNLSPASAVVTIMVDTTAPSKPTITNASGTVRTSTSTITGTADAGTTVTVYDSGTLLGSAVADGSGNFSFTPGTALSEGSHTITAKAADAAGNLSPASAAVTITVDTAPDPVVTAIHLPANGSYKAGADLDFTVDFSSSVAVTGTPRIALTIGSSVVYANYVSGGGSSSLLFTYTVAAGDNDSDGIAFNTLSLNGGTIQSGGGHNADLSFNGIGSMANVLVDTTAPDKPAITSPSGTISTSTPAIAGTAEAGSSVKLYNDGTPLGSVTADGNGNFSFNLGTPLSAGSHTLTATATDAAGNVSPVSSAATINVDLPEPAADGLTVRTSAKVPAQSGIINVAVTPAAGSGNTVYYRVDSHLPAAPNVGDSVTVSAWTENTHGTAAFDVPSANGYYIEAVEVDSNGKVVKWGVSAGVNDGYSITDSSLNLSSSSFDKSNPSDITVPMTLNGNTLVGITKGSETLLAGIDYNLSGSSVTLKSGYLTRLNTGSAALVFHFSAGADQTFSVTVGDTASSSGVVSAFNSLVSSVSVQGVAFGTAISKLNLPDMLRGMVDGISNSLIKIREWVSNITYNPAIAGAYDFTPVLDSGFTLKDSGVTLPHIRVTVAAQSGNSNSNHSNSDTSPAQPPAPKTETKVDSSNNTSVVTTVPDSIIDNGATTQINVTVPTVTTDTTGTDASLNGGEQAHVTISLPESTMIQQLGSHQNVDLTLTVPPAVAQQTDIHTVVTIPVSSNIFTAAKANGADVILNIKDADTEKLAYTWTFKGSDLAKSIAPVSDVNISMAIRLTTEVPQVNRTTPDNKGIVLLFNHSGVLPSTANVTFSAKAKGFQPGQKMYFYYYNATTGQLESQAKEYTVDADGNVTVQINHCSDYVLLPNKARTITLDTRSYTMRPGDSYVTGVKLNGAAGAKIKAYSSTQGVAGVTVLSNGNVKAVGLKPGLTYVMIDVYDGKGKFLTHTSVRLTVKYGVKPNGNSYRQYGIF